MADNILTLRVILMTLDFASRRAHVFSGMSLPSTNRISRSCRLISWGKLRLSGCEGSVKRRTENEETRRRREKEIPDLYSSSLALSALMKKNNEISSR